jgi:hypothetical protein
MSDEDAMDDGRLGDDDAELDSNDDHEDDENSDVDDSMSGEDDDGSGSERNLDIVEKFIRTFRIGDFDTEFDEALCLDRSVIEPVRLTQASYNKPDNWRERNQIGLERMKGKLEYCIRFVKEKLEYWKPSFNLKLIHNSYGDQQLMDGEEPIVWHEQILDEYWDQLKDALSGDELVTNICDIQIVNVEMKNECMATLVEMLVSGSATNLSTRVVFTNTNLCGEGIIWLSKLVDISSNLQKVCLHHNRIGIDNIESARCLSRTLRSHNCIAELIISHCDLGSSPEILLVILQSDVKRIYLRNNNIDSSGAVKIAEYLEGDPPIEHLFLAHNCLNDNDATLISQALKRNTNLASVSLHTNNFTAIGVKALLTCVFDSSTLNALSESNHTLKEMDIFFSQESGISSSNTFKRLNYCIENLLHLDRLYKILLALQDKDSLLQYLVNVPVGLIPEVLAFPLRQDGYQIEHKHLSIVYSTMRWWNMPLLYLYYCCVKSDAKRKIND